VCPDEKWKELIIKQIAHYKNKTKFFKETNEIISEIIFSDNEKSIGAINCKIIKKLCGHLDIKTEIIVSSEQNFDYSGVATTDDWALRHSEQLGATELINPATGAALFSREKFSSRKIKLNVFKSSEIIYSQQRAFEPSLSIIDVLMFNGISGTKGFLKNYTIEAAD